MITIVDYGLSNLLSIKRAIDYFGEKNCIVHDAKDVLNAEKIILPGVGAFKYGMACMNQNKLTEALLEKAEKGTPILGICLGMQMLFSDSEEGGIEKGLGLINGHVKKIPPVDVYGNIQDVPHIGWEMFESIPTNLPRKSILESVETKDEVYFVHSYHAIPEDDNTFSSYVKYGGTKVCATVQKNNIVGCQFHPEKSGKVGLRILSNFLSF